MNRNPAMIVLLLLSFNLSSLELEVSISLSEIDSEIFDHTTMAAQYLSDPVLNQMGNPGFDFLERNFLDPSISLRWLQWDYTMQSNSTEIWSSTSTILQRWNDRATSEWGVILEISNSERQILEINPESVENLLAELDMSLQILPWKYLELPLSWRDQSATLVQHIVEWSHESSVEIKWSIGNYRVEVAHDKTPEILHFYNYSGRHCTLEAVEEQFNLMQIHNEDLSQSSLAIPLFGRVFNSQHEDYWYGTESYRVLIENQQIGEDGNISGNYYFNSIELLLEKWDLADQYGLKSIRISNIEQDSFQGGSLLEAALNQIKK